MHHEQGNHIKTFIHAAVCFSSSATLIQRAFAHSTAYRNFHLLTSLYNLNLMNALPGTDNSILSDIENPAFSNDSVFVPSMPELRVLKPELLTDFSRLQEIYNLRLEVWERSGSSEFVNRKLYPNGWFDELDETAFHWAVINNQNKIIASARVNLFYSFANFPYYSSVKKFAMPVSAPFAFFSRLVVDAHYRQIGLSRKLFNARAAFCEESGVKWSQVFINNPQIIKQFEKSGYKNIGLAEVSYHSSSAPHSVNVLIKENVQP